MLRRLSDLEEKLDSLLKRFGSLREELAARDEESEKLKDKFKHMKKSKGGGGKADQDEILALEKERDKLDERFQKSEREKALLKKNIKELEQEIESKAALEGETLEKLRDIISRIDALEVEIGEMEHEQID